MSLFKSYWDICRDFRVLAAFAVCLIGMTGLFEGFALVSLIPILNIGLSENVDTEQVKYITMVMDWLSISNDRLVQLAIGIFVILGIFSAALRMLGDSLLLILRTRIEEHARIKVGDSLLNMQWSRYLALRLGDISKSIIIEGQQMGVGCQTFLQALGAALVAAAYLVIAVAISLKLTLFSLLFGAIVGVGYYLASKRARKHADRLSGLVSTIGDQIADIFGNLKFFRSTGKSREAQAQAREIYRRYANTYFWTYIYTNGLRFAFEGGAILFVALVLSISLLVYREPVGSALIFLAVFYRLAPRLLSIQDNLFQSRTYLSWYFTWKQRFELVRKHGEYESGKIILPYFNEVEVDGVSFEYPNSNSHAIDNVQLKILKGESVAVVGPSGSGKSTLIDLVTGLLKPTSGSIRLNDVDLGDVDLDAWRRRIGLVMQDTPIFHTSILNNIAWGAERVDRAKAEHAAQMAHAWEFVRRMPSKLDAVVGEKGGRLSGGQRQRLALARALYDEPWLLILDEATSALDSEAEAVIQDALEMIKGKCTILIIAHRLKTVQAADRIIVLDRGKVLEYGGWDELLNLSDGMFRRMARLQGLFQEAV